MLLDADLLNCCPLGTSYTNSIQIHLLQKCSSLEHIIVDEQQCQTKKLLQVTLA
jgi:hypothetical protein